jgi:hypothetical protein
MKDTITNFKFNESEQLTDRENLNESDSPRNKLNDMGSAMVDRDALWEKNFLKLQNFKNKCGHCDVPARYTEDLSFGKWVLCQRADRKKLKKVRLKKLDSISFSWNPHYARWKIKFLKLKKFKAKHGHFNIPTNFSDQGLLNWIEKQRRHKNEINDKRRKMLDGIDFTWQKFDLHWESNYKKILEFKEKHGHLKIPNKTHSKLRAWICTQRRKKDTIDPEKRKKLEKISFEWAPYKNLPVDKFQDLLDFKYEFGHCNVAPNYSNAKLRRWILVLRSTKMKLDPEFVKKLDSIGFVWSIKEQNWEKNFQKLIEFKNIHGHCKVPNVFPENQPLANWVIGLRLPNKGMASAIRMRLEEIGFYEKTQNKNVKKVA